MDELIKEAALQFHEYPNPGKIQVAPPSLWQPSMTYH